MATKPDMLLAFDSFDKGQTTTFWSSDHLWQIHVTNKKRYSSTSMG